MATFTGIGAAFGSFFGADDLEERFNQAIGALRDFQKTAEESMAGFREKGQLSFDQALKQLTNPDMAADVRQLRQFLTTEIQSGLSPFAKLAFEDLNRELENRAIQTGNLRSGAIGIQRAELGRRIAADEFTRALTALDTIQRQDLASTQTFLNASGKFAEKETDALNILGNTVGRTAGALIGLGQVEQQKAVALGTAIGGLTDKAEEYLEAYFTGGASKLMKGNSA